MRVMVFIKGDEDTERGVMPTEAQISAMMAYNEELVKAGIMLAGDGLHPSSKGARVHISGGKATVVDGPFAESKELVAGYWLWQVKSFDEALEWARRCPAEGAEIELRPVFDPDDFGEAFTPELREQDQRLRQQSGDQHAG